jgi:hypothetical protein
LAFLVAPESLKNSFTLPTSRERNLLRLFALPLPIVDTFEELLDYAPELCVPVLPGGQITELVNTLLIACTSLAQR